MPLKHNLMTTLHGLVTLTYWAFCRYIIGTGAVNCLIMCQNARKMHLSEAKNIQKFSVEGAQPLPDLSHIGEGDTCQACQGRPVTTRPGLIFVRNFTALPLQRSDIQYW